MDTRDDRIRHVAHRLWEESGRPDGQADDHWQRAQHIVSAEEGEQSDLPPPGPATPARGPDAAVISVGGD